MARLDCILAGFRCGCDNDKRRVSTIHPEVGRDENVTICYIGRFQSQLNSQVLIDMRYVQVRN